MNQDKRDIAMGREAQAVIDSPVWKAVETQWLEQLGDQLLSAPDEDVLKVRNQILLVRELSERVRVLVERADVAKRARDGR